MKTYTINQHPIRLTYEFDDKWLSEIGIDEKDMLEIVAETKKQIKAVAITLHGIKAQRDASEKMKGAT